MSSFNIGDKVFLNSGGYGGLNYHFLKEEGFYDKPGEVISHQESRYSVKSLVTGRVVSVYPSEMKPADEGMGEL